MSATDHDEDTTGPIFVPWHELSAEALRGVVESFVLREGTDYGEQERTLDSKIAAVMHQLERGEVQIAFDPDSESVTIVRVAPRVAK